MPDPRLVVGAPLSLTGRYGFLGRATVAVGHSILVVAYHVLQRNTPYEELGPDYLLLRHSTEGYKRRLVRQLERLGHKVTLEPGAQSA